MLSAALCFLGSGFLIHAISCRVYVIHETIMPSPEEVQPYLACVHLGCVLCKPQWANLYLHSLEALCQEQCFSILTFLMWHWCHLLRQPHELCLSISISILFSISILMLFIILNINGYTYSLEKRSKTSPNTGNHTFSWRNMVLNVLTLLTQAC